LTILFVDVRGSTRLGAHMRPSEFSQLMNRFYAVATDVLIKTDAYIDKLVGDEVMAVYLPLFAGPEPARQAVRAATELLRALGYGDPGGPWLQAGVGVHTGRAFFGTVAGAEDTVSDFTALGDTVNVAARLVALAGPGEALVSDAACSAAGLDARQFEGRELDIHGKSEPIHVRVMHTGAAGPA
jgi:adenylate cyclase